MTEAEYPNRLAQARAEAGMTQQEMADALGVTLNGYQNYEYGKRDLRSSTLRAASKALGRSASWLLGMDDVSDAPSRPTLSVVAPRPVPDGLSADEAELLACYRASTPERRARLLDDARDCASLSKNEAAPGAPAALTGEVA